MSLCPPVSSRNENHTQPDPLLYVVQKYGRTRAEQHAKWKEVSNRLWGSPQKDCQPAATPRVSCNYGGVVLRPTPALTFYFPIEQAPAGIIVAYLAKPVWTARVILGPVRKLMIEHVQRLVADRYKVRRQDLLSACRENKVVLPRQIAMYLSKRLTLRSLPEIGRQFGGRDHTTVLHAVRKIERMCQDDSGFCEEIRGLASKLKMKFQVSVDPNDASLAEQLLR